MIAEKVKLHVEGKIEGSRATMGIDPAAVAHIMSILTDLYSDAELAVIREYSTNAWDAHVEAGEQRPIEVYTPSALAPYLRIKDYGVGLTLDDIHKVYSLYGASTKRSTNDQVGMLGLGCKSALTYSSQFTVTSIHKGIQITVSVSRDEDGGGSMTVVDERPTNEHDGTEITVPAKRQNGMDALARSFFQFWPKGSVLLNDSEPTHFTEGSPLRLADDFYLAENLDESVVVMGNVAYPCEIPGLPYQLNAICFVPIGSVSFTPSRESLYMDTKTKGLLTKLGHNFQLLAPGAVQKAVDTEAQDHADALRVAIKWGNYLGIRHTTLTYKGQPMPNDYAPPGGGQLLVSPVTRYGRLGGASRHGELPVQQWPTSVWVTGFTPEQYSAPHKRKMLKWCEDSGIGDANAVGQFVCITAERKDAGLDSPYIDAKRVVDYETILKVKVDTVQRTAFGPARLKGSYDLIVSGSQRVGIDANSVDEGFPILTLNGNKWSGQGWAPVLNSLFPDGYTLVCLPLNRMDKFHRDFPQAKRIQEGIDELYEAWQAKLTDDQRLALAMRDHHEHGVLSKLDPTRIDDPELAHHVRVAKLDAGDLVDARRHFGSRYTKAEYTSPLEGYPLAKGTYRHRDTSDHEYDYINWHFHRRQAAEQEAV